MAPSFPPPPPASWVLGAASLLRGGQPSQGVGGSHRPAPACGGRAVTWPVARAQWGGMGGGVRGAPACQRCVSLLLSLCFSPSRGILAQTRRFPGGSFLLRNLPWVGRPVALCSFHTPCLWSCWSLCLRHPSHTSIPASRNPTCLVGTGSHLGTFCGFEPFLYICAVTLGPLGPPV